MLETISDFRSFAGKWRRGRDSLTEALRSPENKDFATATTERCVPVPWPFVQASFGRLATVMRQGEVGSDRRAKTGSC